TGILGGVASRTRGWTSSGRLAAHFAVEGNCWFSGCGLRLFLSPDDEANGVLMRVRLFRIMDRRDKTPKSHRAVLGQCPPSTRSPASASAIALLRPTQGRSTTV